MKLTFGEGGGEIEADIVRDLAERKYVVQLWFADGEAPKDVQLEGVGRDDDGFCTIIWRKYRVSTTPTNGSGAGEGPFEQTRLIDIDELMVY